MGMKRGQSPSLPALSSSKSDDRGVRADSVTNQLRALAKQKPRKRPQRVLEPLEQLCTVGNDGLLPHNNATSWERASVQKQIQGPVSLQWLVDDFVQSAGTGDISKVDHYIRGGIPIDMKHSVLHQTALHASTALHDDTVTRHLVQAGADVNALTNNQESALHLAARYHSVAVAEEVLRNRADLRVHNKHDMLAMEIAADIQDHKMEHLLEPPPNPPQNVHTTSVSSTSLTIAWSSHGLNPSPGYQFRVSYVLSGSLGELFEICSTTSCRICNLMPSSQYEIHVQTGNHTVGWSARSDLLVTETDGDIPNAMASPFITRVSDHSITMRIRLPPNNGADVQRVSIQCQCTGSLAAVATSTFRKLLCPSDQDLRWESILCEVPSMRPSESDPHDKEHTVEGLLPGHVYFFRVKACNSFGWSPDGEVSDGICTNAPPSIVKTTPRSVALVWTKPYSTESIDKYQVQARLSSSTKWETALADVASQRAQVDFLIPSTAYSFRIVPHYASSQRWEDAERCAHTELCCTQTTVPEPPLALRVVDRTAHSIMLSWEMPRCNGHPVEAFRVDYRVCEGSAKKAGDWIVADASVRVDVKTYTVEELANGQAYQFRVYARNSLGEGPAVEMIHPPVWTYAFLPPTAPECIEKTSFSLTILWQDGSSSTQDGSSITGVLPRNLEYEVQMYQVDSSLLNDPDIAEMVATRSGKWDTVVSGLTKRHALVSGLSPLGCYCFRVRARAGGPSMAEERAVFSPISLVFQTLRRM